MMKRATRAAVTIAGALTISGCANNQRIPTPAIRAEAQAALFCNDATECAAFWKRANYWVNKYADFKVVISNDYLIVTDEAPMHSTKWAFRVSRVPVDGQREQIVVKPSCGEVVWCRSSTEDQIVHFNRFVSGNMLDL